jgi:hypothetical protein
VNLSIFEKWAGVVISLVALHSFVLGCVLFAAPGWLLGLFSWDYEGSMFFARQAGAFLVSLSFGYILALKYKEAAFFIVASKIVAVVFLLTEFLFRSAPPIILLAGVFDGLMAIAVGILIVKASMYWEQ